MNFLSQLMGGYQDPSQNSMQEINKIPQNFNNINQYTSQLMQNPGQRLNQMGQDYKQSPGFQRAMDYAMQGSNNAAAAGGMAGSPAHEEQNMMLASEIASQDYNNWMNNSLGLHNQGMQGQNDYARMLSQVNAQNAQMMHTGASNQNMYNANMQNNIAKLMGSGADYLTKNGNPWDFSAESAQPEAPKPYGYQDAATDSFKVLLKYLPQILPYFL